MNFIGYINWAKVIPAYNLNSYFFLRSQNLFLIYFTSDSYFISCLQWNNEANQIGWIWSVGRNKTLIFGNYFFLFTHNNHMHIVKVCELKKLIQRCNTLMSFTRKPWKYWNIFLMYKSIDVHRMNPNMLF